MNALTVLHWSKSHGGDASSGCYLLAEDGFVFETCQRRIQILPGTWLRAVAGAELFSDVGAYRFLLEVVCGLHSRIFGETEIQGQFRQFSRAHPALSPWDRWLLEDAKTVRSTVLGDPGAHSYAGVVRRWCEGHKTVTVIGTGQLALDIQRQLPRVALVSARTVDHLSPSDAIIVAAPVTDSVLETLRQQQPGSAFWIDLRAERGSFVADRTLEDVYVLLDRVSEERRERLPAASELIQRLSRKRCETPWIRPWGWEDVAA